MEIYQLRAFLTVARIGHLTRAAERLNLSQPAVSKQIRALEEELGVTLFERLPTGVALSHHGRTLLPLAERTLENATLLNRRASELRGDKSFSATIGTIIDPDSIRLGLMMASILTLHPLAEIKLIHGISGQVLEKVRHGELNAGYFLGEVDAEEILSVQIRDVDYVVIAPASWRETTKAASFSELAAMPWIGTHPLSSQRRILNTLFSKQGLTLPETHFEVDQEASMIGLVKSGVGLSLMRAEIALALQARGEVSVCDFAVGRCPLSFIYRADRQNDFVIESLLGALRFSQGL